MSYRPSRRARVLQMMAPALLVAAPDAAFVQLLGPDLKPLGGPVPLVLRARPPDDDGEDGDGRPPTGPGAARAGVGPNPETTEDILVEAARALGGGTRRQIINKSKLPYTDYMPKVFRRLERAGRLVPEDTPPGAQKRYRAP